MVLKLKHTYFKNAGPLSTACYSNTEWGSVDNYKRLETKKAVFCWLILHPRHTVVSLNKENCVCVSRFTAGTLVFAFDLCQLKLGLIQLSATKNVSAVQTEIRWYMREKRMKKERAREQKQRRRAYVSVLYTRFPLITPNPDICRVFTRPS